MDTEPIRVRIMSEAYDLADRGDSEGYNAVKAMCSDVLHLISEQQKREWVGLTDEEREYLWSITPIEDEDRFAFVLAVEAKLKEKNT